MTDLSGRFVDNVINQAVNQVVITSGDDGVEIGDGDGEAGGVRLGGGGGSTPLLSAANANDETDIEILANCAGNKIVENVS